MNPPIPADVVIDDLLAALERPGAINAGLAAHVRALLRDARRPMRGTAFDGRLVAVDGVPDPHAIPYRPSV